MSDMKTCFKRVDYDLSNLLHYLDIGDIGLPDIQRPFVWSNAKVRDLFEGTPYELGRSDAAFRWVISCFGKTPKPTVSSRSV